MTDFESSFRLARLFISAVILDRFRAARVLYFLFLGDTEGDRGRGRRRGGGGRRMRNGGKEEREGKEEQPQKERRKRRVMKRG